MSRVSVIVPTHDTFELTRRALETLLASADADSEIIVVDDASADGTASRVRIRFPTVRVIELEQQRGFTGAVNVGLESARGELLVLLNSDTEVEPTFFDVVRDAFTDPRLGVAGARLVYPDGTPQWSGGVEPTLAWLFALASGLPNWLRRFAWYRRRSSRRLGESAPGDAERRVSRAWVSGACMAFRREVYARLGPLDEEYAIYAQDLDYCLRAADSGWLVRVIPTLRVLHHHGATISAGLSDEQRSVAAGTTPENARPENVSPENLALLWSDLWTWAKKRRHRSWAASAFCTLQAGGLLRLFTLACGRWLATDQPSRQRYACEMLRVRAALRSLSSRRLSLSRSSSSPLER